MARVARPAPDSGPVPHPVDLFVGQRLRIRRKLLGLTQRQVAEQMGLTFQLIQKYESGATRISASRLYEFSELLDVPISYFFDDGAPLAPHSAAVALERADRADPPELATAILDLLRSYYGIPEPGLRRRLLELIRQQDRERGETGPGRAR